MAGTIIKKVAISKLGEQPKDFNYWLTRTYAERLATLEEIREEYIKWRYKNVKQGLQRVYRIVKQK
ncbi:MAG: toxin secretion, membrane fusion protein [Verrucomicrobiota bacterium]|nr:toxin secretion, membrane fusion protein [Verrucomicrobiota bacterium]